MIKKSILIKGLIMLILLVFGGIIGYLVGKYCIPKLSVEVPLSTQITVLCMLIPIFFFVIAWHEGGHALAGIKVGFDFRLYIVGPLMWEKQSTGWQFKWNKNINTAGGLVLCLPKNNDDLSRKFSIFSAAGPFASLILAIIAYATSKFLDTQGSSIDIFKTLLIITAFISFFIFIITVIPFHSGGFYTDGARVLRLQQGGSIAQFEVLMLKVITDTSSGIRPKMLNINELEELKAIAQQLNEPFGVYIHGIMHQAAFDNQDLEKAEKHLQDYISEIENVPEGIRNVVWLDASFFYAFAKKDLEKSEYFLSKFKPSPVTPKAQIFATEASLSFLKNEPLIALSKIDLALNEIPNMIDKGVAVALTEKLEILKSQIR